MNSGSIFSVPRPHSKQEIDVWVVDRAIISMIKYKFCRGSSVGRLGAGLSECDFLTFRSTHLKHCRTDHEFPSLRCLTFHSKCEYQLESQGLSSQLLERSSIPSPLKDTALTQPIPQTPASIFQWTTPQPHYSPIVLNPLCRTQNWPQKSAMAQRNA